METKIGEKDWFNQRKRCHMDRPYLEITRLQNSKNGMGRVFLRIFSSIGALEMAMSVGRSVGLSGDI